MPNHVSHSYDAALSLAKRFHELYEQLASAFNYETREDTREFRPGSPNGRLMLAVCRKLMEEMPQLGPSGGNWINVDERKPEVHQEVLVYHILGDQARSPRAIDIAFLSSKGEGWLFPWCNRLGKEQISPVWVTHWMPLPMPPLATDGGNK